MILGKNARYHSASGGVIPMNELQFFHNLSVKTGILIEILLDLYKDDKLWDLIRGEKHDDAIAYIQSIRPRTGAKEAQMIVQAFADAIK